MAGGVAPRVISDSIIFYLDAGNTKSKIPGDIYWKDLGRNQYGFTLSTTSGYSATPSSNGRYITNGGSSSFCASESTFALPNQVTYNFWTRLGPSDAYIFSDNGQSSTGGHVWFVKSNNQLGIGYSTGVIYAAAYTSAFFTGPGSDASFYDNEWVNTTYTVDYSNPSNCGVYRNGVLFATQSLTATASVSIPVPRNLRKYIGNYSNINLSGTGGDISIVQLYSRILSAAEIKRNYDAMLPRHSNAEGITTNGLALYLDMANRRSYSGTGAIWTDIGPSGYTFSLTGSTIYTSTNKGRIRFSPGTGSRAESATAFPMYSQTSYSFWADCGTSSQNLTFLSDSGQSATQGFVWVYRKSLSDDLILEYSDGSAICGLTASNFFTGYAANRPSSAKWVNITAAVDYSGASASIYRDRDLYATFSMSGTPQVPISLVKYIGSYSTASVIPTGDVHRMATVAIYNRLLTADEVNLNYQALRLRYL